MSPQLRRLPLFPLTVVLFPNAVIPLHVFEERYKLMIQRCLDGDSQFGVVLIRSGEEVGEPAEPHSVGTVARIRRVDRLEEGRMLLNVAGESRFRIDEITQLRPYMEAEVELMQDDEGSSVSPSQVEAVRAAITRHMRLVMGLQGGWVREAKTPDGPVELSYFAAALLGCDLSEKQALLEEPSAARRLRTELLMLEQEDVVLRKRVSEELKKRMSGS